MLTASRPASAAPPSTAASPVAASLASAPPACPSSALPSAVAPSSCPSEPRDASPGASVNAWPPHAAAYAIARPASPAATRATGARRRTIERQLSRPPPSWRPRGSLARVGRRRAFVMRVSSGVLGGCAACVSVAACTAGCGYDFDRFSVVDAPGDGGPPSEAASTGDGSSGGGDAGAGDAAPSCASAACPTGSGGACGPSGTSPSVGDLCQNGKMVPCGGSGQPCCESNTCDARH